MKKVILFLFMFIQFLYLTAQSEFDQIQTTLNDYIEGSTEGQPDRLKTAFHPDLNLYYINKEQKLGIYSGTKYIEGTKQGEPTGEAGKIISIDYERDIAVAKVEISHPENPNTYIDYFMLLKVEGKWTIIHKCYTRRTSNKTTKKK